MSKDRRLFARFDLDYADHPKIMALSDAAFRAHVEMILYARKYMTDGVINNRVANRLANQWDTDVLTELQSNDDIAPSLVVLENGDYYLHGFEDMQETRAEIEARTARNRANGQKGGRPRVRTETHSVNDSDTGPRTQPGAQNKAETETETETVTTTTLVQPPSVERSTSPPHRHNYPDNFETFWEIYPRRESKKYAHAAFETALERADLEKILEGARRYRDDPNRLDGFTKIATTWLRGDSWEDPPLPKRNSAQPKPKQTFDQIAAMGKELQQSLEERTHANQ